MKFLIAVLLIVSCIYADNQYVSNKKYTYDEVTEILSDKIIENRKRIDEVKKITLKDYDNLKILVDELSKKVEDLTNTFNSQKTPRIVETQPKKGNLINHVSEEINKLKHTEFEEVVIEKELYEKVN